MAYARSTESFAIFLSSVLSVYMLQHCAQMILTKIRYAEHRLTNIIERRHDHDRRKLEHTRRSRCCHDELGN